MQPPRLRWKALQNQLEFRCVDDNGKAHRRGGVRGVLLVAAPDSQEGLALVLPCGDNLARRHQLRHVLPLCRQSIPGEFNTRGGHGVGEGVRTEPDMTKDRRPLESEGDLLWRRDGDAEVVRNMARLRNLGQQV